MRAEAALTGLAVGDALGMPTQSWSRAEIRARFGRLTGFEPGPPDQPIAPGLPAGTVTDDTEQAVLLGRLLVEGDGRVDPHALATRLLAWETDLRRRGSHDLLGPSTAAALAAVRAGTPVESAGRNGTTNGAAMRATPIGIACPPDRVVDAVVAASRLTHGTGVALAGAAAVAAAVSVGIDGGGLADAIPAAVAAAESASRHGRWVAAGDVAARIGWAVELVRGQAVALAGDLIYRLVGTSVATQESVPAAFAVLAVCPDDPWRACLLAAGLGGDTDTIAAMAGAIAGACGGRFPAAAVRRVREVNDLPLAELAKDLVALRG